MDKVLTRLFIFIVLLLNQFAATSQNFPVLHYEVEDGLPSNVIYEVYKDSKGYLWIATDKGVARYNGIKFEVFTTSDGLPDNEILLFQEDPYGRIWFGTLNGERCFYKDGVFHTEANTPFLKLPFRTSHTRYIKVQPDGVVSICYDATVVNYDRERCWVVHTDKSSCDKELRYTYFHMAGNGRYNIYVHTHFYTVDSGDHVYEKIDNRDEVKGIYLSQDDVYVQLGQKIYSQNLDLLVTLPDELYKSGDLNTFRIFENDTFYCTNDGLRVNRNIRLFRGEPISSVAVDRDHNYWIGTLKNGVYVLPSYYLRSSLCKNAFSGIVEFAYASKGSLAYIADHHVYNSRNGISKAVYEFEHSKQSAYFVDERKICYKMSETKVDILDNIFSPAPKRKFRKLISLLPKEIVVDSGLLYARTTHSIEVYNLNNAGDSVGYIEYSSRGITQKWQRVFSMAKAPTGRYWFSMQEIMFEINDDEKKILPQFHNSAFKNFTFIGDFLVGYTQKNKLTVCSNYLKKDVHMSEITGHNCIWDRFYKLDDFHLLISTSNKYRLLTVDNRPGYPNFNISVIEDPFIPLQAEVICCDNSSCYFFKEGSITTIPIPALYIRQTPPKLEFASLKAGKDVRFIDSVATVSYADSRNISIYFTTLSFSSKDVSYQYSISKDNIDNWRTLQGEQINLVNIGFGNYVVKVRARTASSAMGEPIVFRLRVARPFWLSWWFISGSAFIVAVVIWLLVRKRTALVLSKNQKEHETQVRFMKSEYKALNALMNPHFIFNTLNNVQSLVNSNDKLAANEYLRVFADLIRQNMHNVSKELIPLSKEMELVTNYLKLEKLRFEDKLSYDIFIDDDLHLAEVMVPPLIFQPLVENAIKHGVLQLETHTGHVHIRIFEDADVVYMQVKDNGIGLSKSLAAKEPAHESFGLENIRKRIDHLSIIQNKYIALHITEETNGSDGLQWTVASISMQA